MIDPALAACAPHVDPATIAHIIRVESSGNPLAINVNRRSGRPPYPTPRITSAAHGAAVARDAISQGYNVDLGLMQVNNRNLASLGFSIEQMFEPCTNVRAGAKILSDNYSRARPQYGSDQAALLASLSAYNTGSFSRGFSNGYVAKYFRLDARSAIMAVPASPSPDGGAPMTVAPENPFTAPLSVFSRGRPNDAENAQPNPGQDDRAVSID